MLSTKILKLSKMLVSKEADEEQNIAIEIEYYDNLFNAIKDNNNHKLDEALKYTDVKVNEEGYNYSDTILRKELIDKYKISPIAYAFKYNNLYAFMKLIKNGANINDETLGGSLISLCAKDPKKLSFAQVLLNNGCEHNDSLIFEAKLNNNNKFINLYKNYL